MRPRNNLESQISDCSSLSNYLKTPRYNYDQSNINRLSIYLFDPQYEDTNSKEKAPVISRAAQNRLVKEIVKNLQDMGFNSCVLHASQINDTKTFTQCFMFAYSYIGDSFTSTKRWDDDFIRILKMLRYPCHIQRNDLFQLSGGRAWPDVLNGLHWLICMARYCQEFQFHFYLFENDGDAALLTECKWDFILKSIKEENRQTAVEDLDVALRNIAMGDRSMIDPINLENSVNLKQSQFEDLDKYKIRNQHLIEQFTRLKSDIDKLKQCNERLAPCINTFDQKKNSLLEEINNETEKTQKLKTQISELRKAVSDQAIGACDVSNLHQQIKLSKKRINEFVESCEFIKNDQWKVDLELNTLKFTLEEYFQKLSKKIVDLKSRYNDLRNLPSLQATSIEFTIEYWKKRESENKLKEWIHNIKMSINTKINDLYLKISSFEKENHEKNVNLIVLKDKKCELLHQTAEVDNQYKVSENNVKNMMTGYNGNSNEDSMLKLTSEKWNIKKRIEDTKTEIMMLESKIKLKKASKLEQSIQLDRNINELYNQLDLTNKSIIELCTKKSDQVSILYNNVLDFCKFAKS